MLTFPDTTWLTPPTSDAAGSGFKLTCNAVVHASDWVSTGAGATSSCLASPTMVYDEANRTLQISDLYEDSDNTLVLHRNHLFSFTLQGWTWATTATSTSTSTVDFTIKSKWTETLTVNDVVTNPIYDIDSFGTFSYSFISAYGDFTFVPTSYVPGVGS